MFGPIVIVTVRLMGPYKRAAGITDDVTVTPEEPNLGGVLQAIAARFPEAGKKLQPVSVKSNPRSAWWSTMSFNKQSPRPSR